MCSRPQYTDLAYVGSTGSCEPMRVIFGSAICSWYTSLNIKFGSNDGNVSRRFFENPEITAGISGVNADSIHRFKII